MDFKSLGFELQTGIKTQFYANDTRKIYPINACTSKMKETLHKETHHYCNMFTNDILATLPSAIYIGNKEYNVDKNKRILMTSYDGQLNLWQCCPTFYSDQDYLPGTPIVNESGQVVSIVTSRKNGRYAISCFDGYSGKFETAYEWFLVNAKFGIVYGNRIFQTREELQAYLQNRKFGAIKDLQPILINASIPRIVLFDKNSGLELAHTYVRGEFTVDVCTEI